MPPGSAEDRGYHRATVKSLMHRKYASDEVGRLLEDLKPWAEQLDPDSDDARLVRITEREYLHRVKVPAEMVAELAQIAHDRHAGMAGSAASKRFRPLPAPPGEDCGLAAALRRPVCAVRAHL